MCRVRPKPQCSYQAELGTHLPPVTRSVNTLWEWVELPC